MNRLLYFLFLITPLTFLSHFALSQCDINSGCAGAPVLLVDAPTFDSNSLSITLGNVTVGEFACTSATYQSGVAFYLYQLLPDGSRMVLCNVLNDPPFNVIGSIAFSFGQTSFCDGNPMSIGSFNFGAAEGFIACDGAFLEIEAAMYITDNMAFDPSSESVFSALTANEFITVDLGTLNIDINDEFAGNGQPLTSANVTDLETGSDGPIAANCGDDVQLFVEGLSRLANCPDYDDINTGIASELSNEFFYTVNGGAPVIIQNAATGAAGGQLTGPDPAIAGNCYAGILGNYTLAWADLPADLCDGSTVVVTITTSDVFTGQTVSDDITINYSGAACTTCAVPGCTDVCAANFEPTATEDDGTCTAQLLGCMDATACNFDPIALCDDPANPCDFGNVACDDPCNAVSGCTDATACNFNMAACIDDNSCILPDGCTDPDFCEFDPNADCDDGSCVTPNVDPGNCDDGDCTNGLETYDTVACNCVSNPPTGINGCTDMAFCEFDPNADCDDGSCVTPNVDPGNCDDGDCTNGLETYDTVACNCVSNPPTGINGCTDMAFCEFDPNADCDDGSCVTPNVDPGNCDDGDCTNGLETYDTVACNCVSNPPTGINGCTDAAFCEFDPTADCDDGSCVTALPTAATIAGGPFQFCANDGTPDFVSGITVNGGTGANSAWVVTDDLLNILALPAMPGDVDFDGAGFGTCQILYVTFENITGAEVGMNTTNFGGCFALSNSIEVVRDDCGICEEEITGILVGIEEGCNLGGITITIIAPDATNINVVTEADGSFTVPDGPFPCGSYTAAFFDVNEVPFCYTETGSTAPISFNVDGNEDGNADVSFIANPAIPTLSQWGLMSLALLLMIFGAIKLAAVNKVQLKSKKA